jgi:hypothetical protein
LKGKALKLITVDGNPGLIKVRRELYPQRRIQHYIAHKLRNVVVKLKRYQRPACMGEARVIFGALSRTEATRRFEACRAKCLVRRRVPFAAWRRACSTASASRGSSGVSASTIFWSRPPVKFGAGRGRRMSSPTPNGPSGSCTQ